MPWKDSKLSASMPIACLCVDPRPAPFSVCAGGPWGLNWRLPTALVSCVIPSCGSYGRNASIWGPMGWHSPYPQVMLAGNSCLVFFGDGYRPAPQMHCEQTGQVPQGHTALVGTQSGVRRPEGGQFAPLKSVSLNTQDP